MSFFVYGSSFADELSKFSSSVSLSSKQSHMPNYKHIIFAILMFIEANLFRWATKEKIQQQQQQQQRWFLMEWGNNYENYFHIQLCVMPIFLCIYFICVDDNLLHRNHTNQSENEAAKLRVFNSTYCVLFAKKQNKTKAFESLKPSLTLCCWKWTSFSR